MLERVISEDEKGLELDGSAEPAADDAADDDADDDGAEMMMSG